MKTITTTLGVYTISLLLSACGGSSGGDSAPAPSNSASAPTSKTGKFLDSAVIGIGYKTATQNGTTNAIGEFSYLDGESVVFFIGDLELPSAPASAVVTPVSIAGAKDTSDQKVVNIARLLQSIDEDGDTSNGITISSTAIQNATAINFDQTVSAFEVDSAVTTLVANSGSSNITLIPSSAATTHLESTLDTVSSGTIGFDPSQFVGRTVYQVGAESTSVFCQSTSPNTQNCQLKGSFEMEIFQFAQDGALTVRSPSDELVFTGTYEFVIHSGNTSAQTLNISGNHTTLGAVSITATFQEYRANSELFAICFSDKASCTQSSYMDAFVFNVTQANDILSQGYYHSYTVNTP